MSLELSHEWQEVTGASSHDDCYTELAAAVVKQACKDYKAAIHRLLREHDHEAALRMQADVEKFFRSAWFTMLCDFDGEALMKQIYDMEFHVWKRRFQR